MFVDERTFEWLYNLRRLFNGFSCDDNDERTEKFFVLVRL